MLYVNENTIVRMSRTHSGEWKLTATISP